MAAPEKLPSSRSDNEPPLPPHGLQRDLDLDALSSCTGPVPVIDLHQLASQQRSRDSLSRHPTRVFALGSSPMTPRTARGLKGKGRAMTMGLVSPRGAVALSRALSSPALLLAQTQTPPLSPPLPPPPDFTFAPAATSTQQHQPAHGSQRETFGLEACVPRGSGVLGSVHDVDVDVDAATAWVRDVPMVEADGDVDEDVGADVGVDVGMSEEKGASRHEGERGLPYTGSGPGLLGEALQVFSVPADEHV